MSVWFAGTAVLPQLVKIWGVSLATASWLTLAVQLGFVVGALLSAILNLPDVFHSPRLIAASMFVAAIVNTAFALVAPHSVMGAIVFRFLSGMALAGVYPPAMKILAGWY